MSVLVFLAGFLSGVVACLILTFWALGELMDGVRNFGRKP